MRNILILLLGSALVGCTYIPVLLSDTNGPAQEAPAATAVEVVKPPEVVLDAGVQVEVGQEVLTIWGEDPCQPGFAGNEKLNCISLANRVKVRVHFIRDGMLAVEDWQVMLEGRSYKLVTPAGIVAKERIR